MFFCIFVQSVIIVFITLQNQSAPSQMTIWQHHLAAMLPVHDFCAHRDPWSWNAISESYVFMYIHGEEWKKCKKMHKTFCAHRDLWSWMRYQRVTFSCIYMGKNVSCYKLSASRFLVQAELWSRKAISEGKALVQRLQHSVVSCSHILINGCTPIIFMTELNVSPL